MKFKENNDEDKKENINEIQFKLNSEDIFELSKNRRKLSQS
jgi:hypothetical protein